MRNKLSLAVVLALLVLVLLIELQEVRGATLGDASCGDSDASSNFKPVEDFLLNLTLHQHHRIKHFPIDYSGGSPDASDQVPSYTTGITDSAASTIPEFPSTIILLVFMVVTVLGVIIFKTKRAI